jgi:hypothetical protein
LTGSESILLPVEVKEFIAAVSQALTCSQSSFDCWDAASSLKENFRKNTRLGISGKEETISGQEAKEFLMERQLAVQRMREPLEQPLKGCGYRII